MAVSCRIKEVEIRHNLTELYMPVNLENIQKGSNIFFSLMKEKILPFSDTGAREYLDNPEIREVVKTMAGEAGMTVFHTRENIHLVTDAYGSIFASSYTQMKQKYNKLPRKNYFYLANVIICVFLAEVDKEKEVRVRWEEEGVSYARMEKLVTDTLQSWVNRQQEEESFSEEWGIALEEIWEIWDTKFTVYKRSNVDDTINVTQTKNNRYSFIETSMRPLVDQKLIINNKNELTIIPKNELYERLGRLYHNQERYQQFIGLIEETKKSVEKSIDNKQEGIEDRVSSENRAEGLKGDAGNAEN